MSAYMLSACLCCSLVAGSLAVDKTYMLPMHIGMRFKVALGLQVRIFHETTSSLASLPSLFFLTISRENNAKEFVLEQGDTLQNSRGASSCLFKDKKSHNLHVNLTTHTDANCTACTFRLPAQQIGRNGCRKWMKLPTECRFLLCLASRVSGLTILNKRDFSI